jgi:hypothetical protein
MCDIGCETLSILRVLLSKQAYIGNANTLISRPLQQQIATIFYDISYIIVLDFPGVPSWIEARALVMARLAGT